MPTRGRQEPASISGTPGQVRRQGSQEPAHRLGVNSSQWGVGSYLLCPFPSPLPESPSPRAPPRGLRVSQLVGGVSIPHLCPYWVGVWDWLTEGGPQRSFVPPDPPPPTSRPCCWEGARVLGMPRPPVHPTHLICVGHSFPGPTPAEQSKGRLGTGSCPKGGPPWLPFPPAESCVLWKKGCSFQKPEGSKSPTEHLDPMPCTLQT